MLGSIAASCHGVGIATTPAGARFLQTPPFQAFAIAVPDQSTAWASPWSASGQTEVLAQAFLAGRTPSRCNPGGKRLEGTSTRRKPVSLTKRNSRAFGGRDWSMQTGPPWGQRTPRLARTRASGQNKDDLECIRVDDDDTAIGQHEIVVLFVSWDDLDDSPWQRTQFNLLPRNLDTH